MRPMMNDGRWDVGSANVTRDRLGDASPRSAPLMNARACTGAKAVLTSERYANASSLLARSIPTTNGRARLLNKRRINAGRIYILPGIVIASLRRRVISAHYQQPRQNVNEDASDPRCHHVSLRRAEVDVQDHHCDAYTAK